MIFYRTSDVCRCSTLARSTLGSSSSRLPRVGCPAPRRVSGDHGSRLDTCSSRSLRTFRGSPSRRWAESCAMVRARPGRVPGGVVIEESRQLRRRPPTRSLLTRARAILTLVAVMSASLVLPARAWGLGFDPPPAPLSPPPPSPPSPPPPSPLHPLPLHPTTPPPPSPPPPHDGVHEPRGSADLTRFLRGPGDEAGVWDVSQLTSLSGAFQGRSGFNGDISGWGGRR